MIAIIVVCLLIGIIAYFVLSRKLFLATFIIVLLGITSFFFVPIMDTFFDTSYAARVSPDLIGNNGFHVEIDIPCNRYYERTVGFEILPPVSIKNKKDKSSTISGKVALIIIQEGKQINKLIELSDSGGAYNDGGMWHKFLHRYPPMGSFFCGKQKINIRASSLDFDLRKHTVTVYVSRDLLS